MLYECKKCQLNFKNKSLLANHYRWKHKNQINFICNKCNKEFFDKCGHGMHIKTCNGIKEKITKTCPICNFEIKRNYDKHLKICDGRGPKRVRFLSKIQRANKTYDEIYGIEKSKIIKNKISNALKNKVTGKALTIEKEKIRTEKIRKKIKERYANGWEVKCGRCKKIDYISLIAGKVKLDGSWELKVAQYLDENKINWKRNKQRFDYINLKNKKSTYCPDFYLKDEDKFIEVKGYKTDLDECKWSQFPEKLEIWDKKRLKELNIL
ncbi:MAG: hypothetical protein JETCAE03_34960 [Ignavibacteriaceae bacterium]|jgi:hypothetical protein|nr:MAG: hypothetical protein JETCAE03_34960 [Ignavibacteriaceae bacterium]